MGVGQCFKFSSGALQHVCYLSGLSGRNSLDRPVYLFESPVLGEFEQFDRLGVFALCNVENFFERCPCACGRCKGACCEEEACCCPRVKLCWEVPATVAALGYLDFCFFDLDCAAGSNFESFFSVGAKSEKSTNGVQ